MSRFTVLCVFFAMGCGSKPPPPAAPLLPATTNADPDARGSGSDAPPPTSSGSGAAPAAVEVNSKEAPVLRCGPKES